MLRGRHICCKEVTETDSDRVSAGKFFWYFLFLFLTLLYYSFYGILTVVISPSVQARASPPPSLAH